MCENSGQHVFGAFSTHWIHFQPQFTSKNSPSQDTKIVVFTVSYVFTGPQSNFYGAFLRRPAAQPCIGIQNGEPKMSCDRGITGLAKNPLS